jgi:hypothetical protein
MNPNQNPNFMKTQQKQDLNLTINGQMFQEVNVNYV